MTSLYSPIVKHLCLNHLAQPLPINSMRSTTNLFQIAHQLPERSRLLYKYQFVTGNSNRGGIFKHVISDDWNYQFIF